jgi:hypothetical protein
MFGISILGYKRPKIKLFTKRPYLALISSNIVQLHRQICHCLKNYKIIKVCLVSPKNVRDPESQDPAF